MTDIEGSAPNILPISVVIPTADRSEALARCFETLAGQNVGVREIVVVDASAGQETKALCEGIRGVRVTSGDDGPADRMDPRVMYVRACSRGAAIQRNEGVGRASQPFILFMDDDVELQQDCLARLWDSMMSDERIGGVSSMIINQRYIRPGRVRRVLYRLLAGERPETFAGKCLGPVVTVLPEDRADLPVVVPVEWLNAGCTLYRRSTLPNPVFPEHFTGYSLGEDANLSLTVAKGWKIVNARTARILHNSYPGPYKPGDREFAKMSLVNRHYIMTRTLGRRSFGDYLKLALFEGFWIVASLRSTDAWPRLPAILRGKMQGIMAIVAGR